MGREGDSAEIGSAVRMLPGPREMWWPRERTAVGALVSAAFGVYFENSGPGDLLLTGDMGKSHNRTEEQ